MTEEEKGLLTNVGVTLLIVQSTEKLLRFVLQHCLPGSEAVSLEDLERSDEKMRKKTLGQFLGILRERVDLDDQFDAILSTFLDCRNILAHRIEEIPGWNLYTSDGQKAGNNFLNRTTEAAMFITKIFAGLMSAWSKQVGLEGAVTKEEKKWLAEIDARYTPAVDTIFFKKV
ncbi:MAG TPA: hypothetical protein VII56_10565 [Rhizomicrobium sp.]